MHASRGELDTEGRIATPARRRIRDLIATISVGSIAAGALVVRVGMAADADIELGRHLAAECMTCHRSATATSTIPNIFGLAEDHLAQVIKAYRAKTLPNAAMQNVASRLSDEDIASLALYFSRTKAP